MMHPTRFPARAVLAACLLAALAACNTGVLFRDRSDSGVVDAPLRDVVGDAQAQLVVTPAATTVMLPLGTASVTATLHATMTGTDGTTQDVTATASWSSSSSSASVANGMVVATQAGAYTIHATLGALTGTATVNVVAQGDVTLPGAPANAGTLLGAAVPTGAAPLTIAYPLEGAIFPGNLHNVEVQAARTDAMQSLVRVEFAGDLIAVNLIGTCTDITAAPSPGGCGITIPATLLPALVGASQADHMTLRVRLARADGTMLVESAAREVRWSDFDLTGALYYWSTHAGTGGASTAIYRYDFGQPDAPPSLFFDQNRDAPVVHDASGAALGQPCVGCHAISRDGTRMTASFGGSDPAMFGLYDVATRTPIATRLGTSLYSGPPVFAGFSALSPDGAMLVTVRSGTMTLRHASSALDVVQADLAPSAMMGGDRATEPYWSADGSRLVFTGWNPTMYTCDLTAHASCTGVQTDNGDLTPYGQIYVAMINSVGAGTPQRIVPRSSTNGGRDYSSYYPALSDDNAWVVFDRVACTAPASHDSYPIDRTGTAANCSGYDNPGARLMLVQAGGLMAPIDLAAMNDTTTWTNSWPRWAPGSGTFRGRSIYWVAFSSKRPYGLRLAGDATGADATVHPQLWVGAITIDPTHATADPSHPPVWFPLQNADESMPSGNHVPQWVAVFVPSPG